MYNKTTFEQILQRMLEKVPSTMDKREGSIIYDALAPAAIELAQMYIELDVIMNETFADTASREYLIKRAYERGIVLEEATYAVLKGEFNIDVEVGSRFSCNDLNYVATEKISDGVYKMECETSGVVGNKNFGDLIPIDYIEGLQMAKLTEILIPAEDEEDTEHLRERYFESLDSQAFGGNVADYREKVNAIDGVGGVKVYPAWNGGGTVKLLIIDSNYQKPSDLLVNEVQTKIDPIQNQGQGVGLAPIGHVVTVLGCETTQVNIATKITLQEGWTFEDVQPQMKQSIDNYFIELAEEWDSLDNIVVRISQIEMRLLDVTGILDVADTTLNERAENLSVSGESVPICGVITNV